MGQLQNWRSVKMERKTKETQLKVCGFPYRQTTLGDSLDDPV